MSSAKKQKKSDDESDYYAKLNTAGKKEKDDKKPPPSTTVPDKSKQKQEKNTGGEREKKNETPLPPKTKKESESKKPTGNSASDYFKNMNNKLSDDDDEDDDDEDEKSVKFENIEIKKEKASKRKFDHTKESNNNETKNSKDNNKKKDKNNPKKTEPKYETDDDDDEKDNSDIDRKKKKKKTKNSDEEKDDDDDDDDDKSDNTITKEKRKHTNTKNQSNQRKGEGKFKCACVPGCNTACDPDCDCAEILKKTGSIPHSQQQQPSPPKDTAEESEKSPKSKSKDDKKEKKDDNNSDCKKKKSKEEKGKTPSSKNGATADAGGAGDGATNSATKDKKDDKKPNYETDDDDDDTSEGSDCISQSKSKQKLIEKLNLQNLANEEEEDAKNKKNDREKIEILTQTIPSLFRSQFVDRNGDLDYGKLNTKNAEVENHPTMKKILKKHVTTKDEEDAMELDEMGFRFEPVMLPKDFDERYRLRQHTLMRREKEKENADKSENEDDIRDEKGEKKMTTKNKQDMIAREKAGDVSKSLDYISYIQGYEKKGCLACSHGNTSSARMAVGPFNDLIDNYKSSRKFKNKIDLCFDLEEQFEKLCRIPANERKKPGEEDIPMFTAEEIYNHITFHMRDPEEWKTSVEEQLAKIRDHIYHCRLFRIPKQKIDSLAVAGGRNVLYNSMKRYEQIDTSQVMVHDASFKQYSEIIKMESQLKKMKSETLDGYDKNSRVKVNNKSEFVNPQRRWMKEDKDDTNALWEGVT